MHVAEDLVERVVLPQLWLREAAIARAQCRPDAASVRRAIEEARAGGVLASLQRKPRDRHRRHMVRA